MSAIGSLTQVGSQLADRDTVAAIRVHTGGAGLILGADERGRPVTVSFFRAEPTVAAVVGGLGLVQLVAFRALALGAHVVVTTGRPSAWSALASAAPSTQRSAVEIVAARGQPDRYGSSLRPYLLVADSDSTAAVGAAPEVPGWSTAVMVREHLTSWDAGALGRADLILTEALAPQESALLCGAVNLPDYQEALSVLPDETIGLITHGGVRWARLARTALERRVIGPVGRGLSG